MSYKVLTGGNVEFGDNPSDQMGLAKMYSNTLIKEYLEELKEWKTNLKKIKEENRKFKKDYEKEVVEIKEKNKKIECEYNLKLEKWDKNSFLYKIFYFFKKPKLTLIDLPKEPKYLPIPEKPNKPFSTT